MSYEDTLAALDADAEAEDRYRREHWIAHVEDELGHLLREPEGRPHPEAQEVLQFARWRLQQIREGATT
jgi:hypothetical protein